MIQNFIEIAGMFHYTCPNYPTNSLTTALGIRSLTVGLTVHYGEM